MSADADLTDRGHIHCGLLRAMKDEACLLTSVPRGVAAMMKPDETGAPLWKNFTIPTTGRVVTHDTVVSWVTSPAMRGLGVNMDILYRILRTARDPQQGREALALLDAQLRAEGYGGIEGAVQAEAVKTVPKAKSLPEAMKGNRNAKKGENSVDMINAVLPKGGTSAAYLAARIKRDRPDISQRIEAGEFKSMRAAAIEAGIVKVPTLVERMAALWRKATQEQRAEFSARVLS